MIDHKAEHFLHVDTLSQDYSIHMRLHFMQDWIIPLLTVILKMYHGSSISKMHHFSQVRLIVVDRSTGKMVKTKYMSVDTFFCFHHANAYEDKGN